MICDHLDTGENLQYYLWLMVSSTWGSDEPRLVWHFHSEWDTKDLCSSKEAVTQKLGT